MTDYGRGAIGIPCREQGRWSTFWECVGRLDLPPNCLRSPIVRYNNSVAQARNQIAKEAVNLDLDWVFWLDDDMLFAADVLMRILQRPEQIVIGMTMLRCTGDGQFRPIWSNQPIERDGRHVIWTALEPNLMQRESNGLVRLLSGTGGGVLTRRAVFETLPAPWWEMGQYDPEMFWEDLSLYEKATAAGFDIWGDPTIRFGHYNATVSWPKENSDGTWSTVFANGFHGFIELPCATQEQLERSKQLVCTVPA